MQTQYVIKFRSGRAHDKSGPNIKEYCEQWACIAIPSNLDHAPIYMYVAYTRHRLRVL